MDKVVIAMLNMLGGGGVTSAASSMLSQAPDTWNPTLYSLAVNIHSAAVKPLTSVLLSVVFVMELARNSTKIESDRELGVKIIAGTMFKICLVMMAAQNADLFIRAFNGITSYLISGVSGQLSIGDGSTGTGLGDTMSEQVKAAGIMGQAALMVLLLIPWCVSQIASVVATVVLYVRFIEIYALTAFQSLPIALLVNEETRPIGVGYFKSYARACINGVTLFICLALYQTVVTSAVQVPEASDDLVAWTTGNFGNLMMAGIMLLFVISISQRVTRAVTGD
ncbi:type IV secretion system protein [Bifidobacterium sp. SO1]|uniref:type IV secretion system protein n=1 Tax=Bifidobacterium sp. SO1 TaxID=2809029 RepID=UPI001BDC1607|nr:type IV secretion system protein [Bifidobacterium sp. SO1]MBT1160927.1 type IV secretion system protein [Bifidobacterium sp. SO1]